MKLRRGDQRGKGKKEEERRQVRRRTRRSPKSRDLSEISGGERGNRRDFEGEEVKET
jgi:hypothetical protein